MILYWLHHLPSTEQDYQNENTESSLNENRYPRLQKFQETTKDLPFEDIRSLASVNRSFYQMLSPYIFECFDFQGFAADKLKLTFEEIIERHSDHFREIRGRFSYPYDSDGDPEPRSELLLKILKTCPRLTNIDINLDPEHFIPATGPETSNGGISQDSSISNQIPNLFLSPISQLTSLTHLSLSSPYPRPPYKEPFLVEILSNFPQLQSFGCSRIDATYPKPLDDQQPCRSPLGIYLASLTNLVELDLESAECLDASWNQLDWKSSLTALSLDRCDRVSLSVLNEFLELFKSTLKTLTFVEAMRYDPDNLDPEFITDDTFRFELPNLTNLEIISNSAIQFSRAFQNSKHLSWLSLGDYPLEERQDLENLINDRLWPNLEILEITSHSSSFRKAVEGLDVLCWRYGTEIIFNVDFYSHEDEMHDNARDNSMGPNELRGYMRGSHGEDSILYDGWD